MSLILTVYVLVIVGLMTVYSLSISDLVYCVSKSFYDDNEKPKSSYLNGANKEPLAYKTSVEIVKSFKNSSGFYKINGTLENQGAIILSNIQVIKYYKVPSVNDTTLICYEQNIVNCQYKLNDPQLPSKGFFLMMPPAPPEININ